MPLVVNLDVMLARRKMRLAWKKRKAAQKLAGKGVGKKATRVAKPVTKAATEKV